MKRLFNTSFFYLIAGLLAGVFYREYTKYSNFDGQTSLSTLHTHILVLGFLTFLVLILFEKAFNITSGKKFKWFYYVYNVGLLTTLSAMTWKGILDVAGTKVRYTAELGGTGHILLATGLVLLMLLLKDKVVQKS